MSYGDPEVHYDCLIHSRPLATGWPDFLAQIWYIGEKKHQGSKVGYREPGRSWHWEMGGVLECCPALFTTSLGWRCHGTCFSKWLGLCSQHARQPGVITLLIFAQVTGENGSLGQVRFAFLLLQTEAEHLFTCFQNIFVSICTTSLWKKIIRAFSII